MDHALRAAELAQEIYVRSNTTGSDAKDDSRPASFKVIGISLAVGSGLFIGSSFVLKKVGLLRANEKYNEVAGEGYGYLKNAFWWSGMTLMIIGELLNFVAYAFTDAILVTPLGALSVVITTILSAIFLKERLSLVGKVACFLCIVGSVVIVMNAPQESSVADIQEMQSYVITPGFLSYTGVIIVGSIATAFFAGPRWGKKNMLVYISICSWVGGLSVVCTQGLGSAIVAQIRGTPQFRHWFIYVLLAFVIGTLVTEIIYLNKALNLFNAAMVTPTYYVYFTSTTIITSAVLFRGFKGTAASIVTVVMGFLVICSGVVLLQLSKSAKDVPDTAVFTGDLDQIHTIADQEQPETEPKADAIRGAAAIVRNLSVTRHKMEVQEFKRLRDEKSRETLGPVGEDGQVMYEWDGLRRRRTLHSSRRSRGTPSPNPFTPPPPSPHPPLGMSRFPTDEDQMAEEHDRPTSAGALSSIVGTIRSRARSVLSQRYAEIGGDRRDAGKAQSPTHPVQLTEIAISHPGDEESSLFAAYGVPEGNTEYGGSGGVLAHSQRRVQFGGDNRDMLQGSGSTSHLAPPTPPPHGTRRQFSFQKVFRRHHHHGGGAVDDDDGDAHNAPEQASHALSAAGITSRGYTGQQAKGATEEERLGLVTGDSHTQSMPTLQRQGGHGSGDDDDDDDDYYDEDDDDLDSDADIKSTRYRRDLTLSPPRRDETEALAAHNEPGRDPARARWDDTRGGRGTPPRPPPGHEGQSPPEHGGSAGAFL